MKRCFALFLVLLCTCSPAFADTAGESGKPSGRNDDGFRYTLALGVGAAYSTSPYKDSDGSLMPLPLIFFDSDYVYVRGLEAGFKAGLGSGLTAEAFVTPRFGFDPDDTDDLEGLDERFTSADAGLRLRWNTGGYGAFSISAATDIGGVSGGQEYTLAYSYPIFMNSLVLTPSAAVKLLSGDLVGYYYGVDSDEAIPGAGAYEADATVNGVFGLSAVYSLTDHWKLHANAAVELLGQEITDSPMVDDDAVFRSMVGVAYKF